MLDLWMLSADSAWCALPRRHRAFLSSAERRRLEEARHASVAQRFLLGRVFIRMVLARVLCCAPQDVPLISLPSGKMVLDASSDIVFSLSHSGPFMMLGVARGVALGVDVEQTSRADQAFGIARHYFSDGERKWLNATPQKTMKALNLWTLKESVVKALGLSIWDGLRGVQIDATGPKIRIKRLPGDASVENWTLATGYLNDALVFSLALKTEDSTSSPIHRIRQFPEPTFSPSVRETGDPVASFDADRGQEEPS